MATKETCQFVFYVPSYFLEGMMELVCKRVIQQIIENCNNGIDREGKNFKPYSKDYVESLDFENAGKSESEVNLRATGDMLAEMDIIDINASTGKCTIGYPTGSKMAEQVEGNQKIHGRWFLGLPKRQLESIILYVESNTDKGIIHKNSVIESYIDKFITKLVGQK